MTCGAIRGALLALPLATLLCACQTAEYPPAIATGATATATAMDGVWSSNDGVFVATFERGAFTSRFTKTNEILAQGRYAVAGSSVSLQWISVATQKQRSARCIINSPSSVSCQQDGGGSFDLNRSA